MQKILINAPTLENGNIIPLLLKIKTWQSLNYQITIIGVNNLYSKIKLLKIIKKINFITLKHTKNTSKKISFLFEAVKRNLFLLFKTKTLSNQNYTTIYSISSTCDLVLFPYLFKLINSKIIWVTVFDNIVPFTDPGNKIIRFLAWTFFQISLLFLKKADLIFTISPELKEFLIKKNFNPLKIIVTGNGIESDLIKKAKLNKKYKIDALFIGRINETKGIYDMLEVLKRIKKTIPNFQLAIMGQGDLVTEKKFKEKIAKKNLKNNIQFLGYKTGLEKFNIIKSSKTFLFLSKSKSESFGIALMEAVCSGLPCFTYNLDIFKKIYKNKEINMFKINDFDFIANKIIEIFNQKNFKNINGEKLINKYSWSKIAKLEYQAIKSLV